LSGRGSLPFVEFKADRRFVTGCADDSAKRAVCRGIAALAKACGAEAVAVGVESRADLVAVNEMGFDLVQGHVFGKPMPLKKFVRAAQDAPVMAL
jgi:EAL domain-containing protein (putative c-di-GMP-specific phosphodiesterase class I)